MTTARAVCAPAAFLACALGLAATQARAAPPEFGGPICRLPEVLELIARDLIPRRYSTPIDPRSVAETPAPEADTVRCTLCLPTPDFDTPRYGAVPVSRCQVHSFDVRSLQNGLLVSRVQ